MDRTQESRFPMTLDSRHVISGDHPALPHHFPGDPVVPAVVILGEVARVIGEQRPGVWVSGIRRVKFTAPLRPGQAFIVSVSFPDAGAANFECRMDDGEEPTREPTREPLLVARGQFLLSSGEGVR